MTSAVRRRYQILLIFSNNFLLLFSNLRCTSVCDAWSHPVCGVFVNGNTVKLHFCFATAINIVCFEHLLPSFHWSGVALLDCIGHFEYNCHRIDIDSSTEEGRTQQTPYNIGLLFVFNCSRLPNGTRDFFNVLFSQNCNCSYSNSSISLFFPPLPKKDNVLNCVFFWQFFFFMYLLFIFTSFTANIVALLQTPTNAIKTVEDLLNPAIEIGVQVQMYSWSNLLLAAQEMIKTLQWIFLSITFFRRTPHTIAFTSPLPLNGHEKSCLKRGISPFFQREQSFFFKSIRKFIFLLCKL